MSWLSVFLKKDVVKQVLAIGKKLLGIFIGKVSETLQEAARQAVLEAEATGKTGAAKYEMAYKILKSKFPQLRESVLNLAIEVCVNAYSTRTI